MTDHEKSRQHARRTTPSEAVGESGDREARQQADDAVVQRPGTAEDGTDAGGHRAKRHRPGIGREEQIHPDDELQEDSEDR
ncbi:hypothetical protein Snoj_34530 [Streptomyces nojiriensis]|uniref:Uncharacterized protein n=1 Tax=Streptomyces nojiriensis TaxID=66374 RepID=A0ABQ3SN24_9ACTN|nr:hypothetical protein [Streptomyces nojiriensis]QTI43099.1 hypothetical protein JYK04_00861 [Streptomyces nojiriensis]GGS30887.1 hypothetical protein GCM10010205_71440 [Streptomyces nojiriensis]GHI69535.1 hypothetical protein Snoj_34530 [Streptomyces nojiriensis]